MKLESRNKLFVKVYHGYGHAGNLIVFGHVFEKKRTAPAAYAKRHFHQYTSAVATFFVQPVPDVKLRLRWHDVTCYTTSQDDGYFKFEWVANEGISAGWHTVMIDCVDEADNILCTGEGKLFVPQSTQYAFVSDIDDTVLVSHSSTIFHRLRVLFTKNPHTRSAFPDVIMHYRLLALAHATTDVPNPFFYVSSSEWNLYDDLVEFFTFNGLPKGVFLLNQVKKWYQLLQTGKTKHEGKLLRVVRIMEAFPVQKFILLGDNSQKDPSIYAAVIEKYGDKIFAVYIRSVHGKKEAATREILEKMEQRNVHTCLYSHSSEAIEHSVKIGLISSRSL